MLALQLPAGAQTWISCGYDSAWSQESHLAALNFDAIQISNWQRGGGTKADMPKPLQRPSDVTEKTSKRDRMAERAQAAFERQQAVTSDPTPKPRARDAKGRFIKEA